MLKVIWEEGCTFGGRIMLCSPGWLLHTQGWFQTPGGPLASASRELPLQVSNTTPSSKAILFLKYIYMYCVFLCMYQMCTGAHGGEKRALDPLESQAVVSHPTWVLETKLWSSAAAASTLHWGAVGPAPQKLPLRTRL